MRLEVQARGPSNDYPFYCLIRLFIFGKGKNHDDLNDTKDKGHDAQRHSLLNINTYITGN